MTWSIVKFKTLIILIFHLTFNHHKSKVLKLTNLTITKWKVDFLITTL